MPATLPIVQRELRVRARQRATFGVRMSVGALGFLMLLSTLPLREPVSVFAGREAFGALAGLMILFCGAEGLRLSYDSLSRERRNGTLGLLFLTDLRGYDVVLGKLVATGWTAVQGLLALIPLLALPLLLGGVSPGQVALLGVALLNLLFATLAVGLWASARSREGPRALSLALTWNGLWWVLPLVLEVVLEEWLPKQIASNLFLVSPLAPVLIALNALPFPANAYGDAYGISLLTTHLLGWLWLGGAMRHTRRAWREGEAPPPLTRNARRFRADPPSTRPLAWLFSRDPRRIRQGWIAAVLLELPLFLSLLIHSLGWDFRGGMIAIVVHLCDWGSLFLGTLLLASLIVRPLVDLRQSGLAESLLATRVTAREFQAACWAALRQPVMAPVLTLLAVEAGLEMAVGTLWETGSWGAAALNISLSVVWLLVLCQLGLRLAIIGRKPERAIFYTVLWSSVIPFGGLVFLPPSLLVRWLAFLPPEWSLFLPLLLYWLLLWQWARIPLWPAFRRQVAHPDATRRPRI